MKSLLSPVAVLLAGFFVAGTLDVALADTNAPVTLAQYYGGDSGGSDDYHPSYHQEYHHSYCHNVCYRTDYYGHCVGYHRYCQ